MIDINKMRRLAQAATPGAWKMLPVGDGRQKFAVADSEFLSILTVTDEGGATFGTVYDDADAKFIAAANPATISELLDRLEAAEQSADWHKRRWMALQMHQTKMREPERTMVCDIIANGELLHPTVAGNRYIRDGEIEMIDTKELRPAVEAAGLNAISMQEVLELLDRLEAAEKTNREWLRANAPGGWIDNLRIENDALRAKIEQMEKQEPVGTLHDDGYFVWRERPHPYQGNYAGWKMALYLAPGAKGEEK